MSLVTHVHLPMMPMCGAFVNWIKPEALKSVIPMKIIEAGGHSMLYARRDLVFNQYTLVP